MNDDKQAKALRLKAEISNTFLAIDNTGSWEPLIAKMADNIEFRSTIPEGTPISGTFKGKEAVRNYFTNILPSVASFKQNQAMEFFSDDETVVIIGDDSYTLATNGKTFRSPYAIVIKFEETNNLIETITIIQDLSGLYESYKV